jgi:hypothetical protein
VQLELRYGIRISKQAIDERFNSYATAFFKTVLEKLLNKTFTTDSIKNFKQFNEVRIKDSTCFQIPENMKEFYPGSGGSSSPASIRIQFEYDIKTGKVIDISLYPFNKQDVTNAGETLWNINKNDLVIRDLGYIKTRYLKEIKKKGAFYLNRLQNNVNIYEKISGEYKKIDLCKLQKQMKNKGQSLIEKEVYIDQKEKFKTRMIVELLPKKIVSERIRKAEKEAKKKGRQLSKKYKSRAGLNIFITNINNKLVDKKDIRNLYSLRWQIELIFKIWKSILKIHEIKKMKVERFESFLYAKLIWVFINWQILWQFIIYFFRENNIEISPFKFFKILKNSLLDLRRALYAGSNELNNFIEKLAKINPTNYKSEKKKDKVWSYEIIRMF